MNNFSPTNKDLINNKNIDSNSKDPTKNQDWVEHQSNREKKFRLSFFQKCRHKISYAVWNHYGKLVKIISKNPSGKPSSDFKFKELKIGKLSTSDLNLLRESVGRSPHLPKASDDLISGYFTDIYSDAIDIYVSNKFFTIFDLKKETKNIKKVFLNIAPEIRACLGHPFRIANVNCWGVMPSSAGIASNAWHVDGYPRRMYKLVIYLNPPSRDNGTSEVLMPDGSSTIVEGSAGTWMLFNSSTLSHRGIPATKGERIIINATIVPAFKENVFPVIAGMSSNFPWFPWSIPNQSS